MPSVIPWKNKMTAKKNFVAELVRRLVMWALFGTWQASTDLSFDQDGLCSGLGRTDGAARGDRVHRVVVEAGEWWCRNRVHRKLGVSFENRLLGVDFANAFVDVCAAGSDQRGVEATTTGGDGQGSTGLAGAGKLVLLPQHPEAAKSNKLRMSRLKLL